MLRMTAPFAQGSLPSQASGLAALGAGTSDAAVRTGGYEIRPYGPASGLTVGAACMAARNRGSIRAGAGDYISGSMARTGWFFSVRKFIRSSTSVQMVSSAI